MYICASKTESHSNAIDEAMSNALPVIGPAIPALFTQLPPATHDLIFTPRTVEALASKIITLADDPERQARIGAANRDAVAARYSEAVIAWYSFYETVLRAATR
jgi:glycosyltransferase involved in cell wall biosynthesis